MIENNRTYDACLIWLIDNGCNLNCEYCINSYKIFSRLYPLNLQKKLNELRKTYDGSTKYLKEKLVKELFKKMEKCNRINKSARTKIGLKIDVFSLIKSLDKTKKIFRIGFTGGEPFLIHDMIKVCAKITEKHFISFNTNLVSGDIKKFAQCINPKKVIVIHASLHIKELERLNLINKYVENFKILKDCSFQIFAQEVGYPPLAKEAYKYKKFFKSRGINISFGEFIGSYDCRNFPESYTAKQIRQFGLRDASRNKFNTLGRACIAGYNAAAVATNGDIFICNGLKKRLNNSSIYKEIKFNKAMMICPKKICSCPFNLYDDFLFKKAITATKGESLIHD